MKEFDVAKQTQFKTMFFLLKILALFFCAMPLFQVFFKGQTNEIIGNSNYLALIITFAIVLAIMFLWLVMDYNRQKLKFILLVEILIFFSVCTASVYLSGSYMSYYKFLFIFMIVSYTIEFGIKIGIAIASASAISVLAIDLLFYKGEAVNPYFQTDLALTAMFMVVAWILGFYVRMEQRHIEQLKDYANIDGLTEVFNHRYFHEIFKIKCEESIEEGKPISLIMLDIDYFKNYNDMYGHQQGDEILRIIADILKNNVGEGNIVCRYGGEEFCIILPNVKQEQAIEIADNIRKIIFEYEFFGKEHMPNGSLTVSIGVSQLYDKTDEFKNIIFRADAALYRAKFFRKNRVETYMSIFDQFSHLDKNNVDDSVRSLKALITLINSRDRYTYNHIERVVYFCGLFANFLDLNDKERNDLIYGAYLHDLGKINVSKDILITERKLTAEEWDELKKHPIDSADIIRKIEGLEDVVEIVLEHHEKFDGTGYPMGIKGENIHYLSRVLTIVDSFDAMTNKRPYQDKKSYKEAFDEIRKCSGTHFDPVLAEKFIEALNKL